METREIRVHTCWIKHSNSKIQNSVASFCCGSAFADFFTSSKSACSQSFVIPCKSDTLILYHVLMVPMHPINLSHTALTHTCGKGTAIAPPIVSLFGQRRSKIKPRERERNWKRTRTLYQWATRAVVTPLQEEWVHPAVVPKSADWTLKKNE